jgi:hypothetical protein
VKPALESRRSFVLQFRSDSDPAQGKIVGRIEHVPSGRSTRFTSRAGIDEFVARILREETRMEGSSDTPSGTEQEPGGSVP